MTNVSCGQYVTVGTRLMHRLAVINMINTYTGEEMCDILCMMTRVKSKVDDKKSEK